MTIDLSQTKDTACGLSGRDLRQTWPESAAAIEPLFADCSALLGVWGQPEGALLLHRHDPPSAACPLEELIYLRDLLHVLAERFQRLLTDSRPLQVPFQRCTPKAGYNRWTSDELARQLRTECARLARISHEFDKQADLSADSRRGLRSIGGQLLSQAGRDGRDHLHHALLTATGQA